MAHNQFINNSKKKKSGYNSFFPFRVQYFLHYKAHLKALTYFKKWQWALYTVWINSVFLGTRHSVKMYG